MIYQLVYISAASRPFGQSELEELLTKARENNEKLGVSGMLLYHENAFIQILEGPEDAVTELYAKIANDARHTNPRVLLRREVDAPSFPDWSMGFYRSNDRTTIELPGFNDFLPTGGGLKEMAQPDAAHRALLAFRDGRWRQQVNA